MFERMLMTKTSGGKAPKQNSEQTGPTVIASAGGLDWLGEVEVSELMSGVELATELGLTAGVSINEDIGWLHVRLDGQELFIAKKPFRHSTSWLDIYNSGAVYGDDSEEINLPNGQIKVNQNVLVNINSQDYKVRLLRGGEETHNIILTNNTDPDEYHQSEFNRILYPLVSTVYEYQLTQNLAEYSHSSDFGFNGGVGRSTICMETDGDKVITRGRGSAMQSPYAYSVSQVSSAGGWRPVLEKA